MTQDQPKIEPVEEWGPRVLNARTMLMHTATLVVGMVDEFFPPGTHQDSAGNILPAAVVKLSTGHTLVADPQLFIEMTEDQASFYVEVTNRMTGFVSGAMQFAGQKKIPQRTAVTLLGSVLRSHILAMETLQ